MTASPVFHEALKDGEKILQFENISHATMTEICLYIYSEIEQFDHSNMLDILMAASHLQMKFLMDKVIDFICNNGTNDHTVFQILEANSKDNNMRINLNCFNYIQKSYKTVLKSIHFQKISYGTLRAILQTCNMPKINAEDAVEFWSKYPDNVLDDPDEIIALITLMKGVEERDHNVQYQNQSVAGSVASCYGGSVVANSSSHISRQQNYLQKLYNMQQQRYGNLDLENRSSHKSRQRNGNYDQQNFRNQLGSVDRHMGKFNDQNHFIQKQRLQAKLLGKSFSLQGQSVKKCFKFANLNFKVMSVPVVITEILFIYDLSTTDKEFHIRINEISGEHEKSIFSRNVKINGEFTRYVLPSPCRLESETRIWIRFIFNKVQHRWSFENCKVFSGSTIDRLYLHNYPTNTTGQIISIIVFTDC